MYNSLSKIFLSISDELTKDIFFLKNTKKKEIHISINLFHHCSINLFHHCCPQKRQTFLKAVEMRSVRGIPQVTDFIFLY